MSKYGEPWEADADDDPDALCILRDSNGEIVARYVRETDASRIEEAMNACADMADPVAEVKRMRAALENAADFLKVMREHPENPWAFTGLYGSTLDQIRAALSPAVPQVEDET